MAFGKSKSLATVRLGIFIGLMALSIYRIAALRNLMISVSKTVFLCRT
jgi:hypothetical protein